MEKFKRRFIDEDNLNNMKFMIMKLLVEPRIAIQKSFKILMRYKLTYSLEKIKQLIEHIASSRKTEKLLPAWVLHGPRKLNLEYVPERKIRPMQVLENNILPRCR